jgi:hypothetical protein
MELDCSLVVNLTVVRYDPKSTKIISKNLPANVPEPDGPENKQKISSTYLGTIEKTTPSRRRTTPLNH